MSWIIIYKMSRSKVVPRVTSLPHSFNNYLYTLQFTDAVNLKLKPTHLKQLLTYGNHTNLLDK